ncbi:MAG: DUF4124 domain-containing protein [Hahellaceae bacterium]|nr:DUF4124 domain-containing protein [Hahellaceae bacterium]MCP5170179.1 DUF4124 domain-containing protein [Hahellaceae bacterium]
MKKLYLVLSLILSFTASTASAQIYQCKDAQNRTVFRDSPCPDQKVDNSTEAGKIWYELKQLLNEGSQIYSIMGPDLSSIKMCNVKTAEFNKKLDVVETSLQKLSGNTHKKMVRAVENLRLCGDCRTSAPNYCRKAANLLKEETAELALTN